MSLADEIRKDVVTRLVEPARHSGTKSVLVSAKDVHDALGLENRFPAVCSALDAEKFMQQSGLTLEVREGPRHGSSVTWRFRLG